MPGQRPEYYGYYVNLEKRCFVRINSNLCESIIDFHSELGVEMLHGYVLQLLTRLELEGGKGNEPILCDRDATSERRAS